MCLRRQVDLRGWLCQPAAAAVGSSSSSSWLGRLGQGATDQLLQGMLSAVPVLKAQLEGQQQQQQQVRAPQLRYAHARCCAMHAFEGL